jgi:membrane protein YdbS with pleckstrin-like domain
MTHEEETKVIRPPAENVSSGKVFRPAKVFRYKNWTIEISIAVAFWALFILGALGFVYMMSTGENPEVTDYLAWVNQWWIPLHLGMWIFNLVWLIPALVLTPIYIHSIEYSVISESGKTMPEVYVKQGILNVTRKHVPFRTITNISSRAGVFDRLFGIGTVEIETAGFSGPRQQGPEQKLEGIVFYEEVRDFILRELRKFREPYTLGTEVVLPHEEPVPRMEDTLDDEMLLTLREIRDLLRDLKGKGTRGP